MAIELGYRVVDVFSDRPLAGNAVCVVLDPCPEPVMGAIAREVNLSETTFPTVIGDDEYDVRIFTPTGELPFAGHPSLGTAWVLGPRRWTQTSAGATVVVEADEAGAVMGQPTPEIGEVPTAWLTDASLDSAEGAYRAEAGGVAHLLVPVTARLDRLRLRPAALGELAEKARVDDRRAVRPTRRLDAARPGVRPGRGVRGSRHRLGGRAHRSARPQPLGDGDRRDHPPG